MFHSDFKMTGSISINTIPDAWPYILKASGLVGPHTVQYRMYKNERQGTHTVQSPRLRRIYTVRAYLVCIY